MKSAGWKHQLAIVLCKQQGAPPLPPSPQVPKSRPTPPGEGLDFGTWGEGGRGGVADPPIPPPVPCKSCGRRKNEKMHIISPFCMENCVGAFL